MKINRKVLVAAGLAVAVAVAGLVFVLKKDKPRRAYIFDKSFQVSLKDAAASQAPIKTARSQAGGLTASAGSVPYSAVRAQDYFSKSMAVSPSTLRYFRFLDKLFGQSKGMEDHLAKAKAYLFSQLPATDAQKIYDLYAKYLKCEMDLMKEYRNWGFPKGPEEIVALLAKIQDYRREALGADVADALFGPDVKLREYRIRRGAIVAEKDLYGEEKEKRIQELNQDVWGAESQAVEDYPNPYNRYREKMAMYQKNLDELGAGAEKDAMVRKFRQEYFTPEVVKRLEGVDAQMQAQEASEASFREAAKKIQEDKALTAQQKEEKMDALTKQTFGQDAGAFQRREAIRLEREKMMREGSHE